MLEDIREKFKSVEGEYQAVVVNITNPRFRYLINTSQTVKLVSLQCNVGTSMYTSYIHSVDIKNGLISIKTRNSIYEFKINDLSINKHFSLTDEEIEYVEQRLLTI